MESSRRAERACSHNARRALVRRRVRAPAPLGGHVEKNPVIPHQTLRSMGNGFTIELLAGISVFDELANGLTIELGAKSSGFGRVS